MVSIGQRFAFPCALTFEGGKNSVVLCTISTCLNPVLFLLVAPPLIFIIYSFEELSDLSEEQETMLPFVPFPSGAVFSVSSLFICFAQNSERSTTPRPLYMPMMVIVLL